MASLSLPFAPPRSALHHRAAACRLVRKRSHCDVSFARRRQSPRNAGRQKNKNEHENEKTQLFFFRLSFIKV